MSRRDEPRYEPEQRDDRRETAVDRRPEPRYESERDRGDRRETTLDRRPEPRYQGSREPERKPVRKPGSRHGHERKDLGNYDHRKDPYFANVNNDPNWKSGEDPHGYVPGNRKMDGMPDMRELLNKRKFLEDHRQQRPLASGRREYEPESRSDNRKQDDPVSKMMGIKADAKDVLPIASDDLVRTFIPDMQYILSREWKAAGFDEEDADVREPEHRDEIPTKEDGTPDRRTVEARKQGMNAGDERGHDRRDEPSSHREPATQREDRRRGRDRN